MVMMGEQVEKRPDVLGTTNVLRAVLLHVLLFVAFWLFAWLHGFFDPKETVIPIDLTVVVNENLDGEENEPPPLNNDTPPPEPPKPAPPKVEEVPVVEDPKVEAVEKIPEKKKPEKKVEKPKEPEKPKEIEKPKPPEPPKKTKEELLQERIKKMRESAKVVKKPVSIEVKNVPSGNGRTAKKTLSDAEIQKLLNQGYRPGTKEQLAGSELQRCVSLIQMALDRTWDRLSPTIDRSGVVLLSVQFNNAGRMINCRIVSSCGSAISDRAALQVANSVGIVSGLGLQFIAQSQKEPVTIRYSLKGK